jgi:hypothetical protein
VKVEMKMSKTLKICAAIAVIGITSMGAVSSAPAQTVAYRHYGQGYTGRAYPYPPAYGSQDPGSSQYPDYSHTGSGYSRGGCSDSPAEC